MRGEVFEKHLARVVAAAWHGIGRMSACRSGHLDRPRSDRSRKQLIERDEVALCET
jgi:hypothetical protein